MSVHDLINDSNSLLIDVRSEGEFGMGNVAGSINIPLNEIPNEVENLKAKAEGKAVLLFCVSGARAGQAEMYLKQSGFENVYNVGSWTQVKIHKMANA